MIRTKCVNPGDPITGDGHKLAFQFVCDECLTYLPFSDWMEMKEKAREAGWWTVGASPNKYQSLDICPRCAKKPLCNLRYKGAR